MPRVELVYFTGCPNVEAARTHIRAALLSVHLPVVWREHDQSDVTTDDRWRQWPSPTVLVDGRDVTGATPSSGASCRASGAADVNSIVAALRRQ